MDGSFHIEVSDAVSWLEGLPAASADLIVLDPGVPGRVVRATGKKAGPKVAALPAERLPALLYEVARVLAPGRVCWWVCETSQAFFAARAAERLGFTLGAPMVWDRGDQQSVRLGFVLPLTRGKARSPGAELIVAPRPSADTAWPGELPESLCLGLIEAATSPGELVIDPFCGAGSVGLAAVLGQRRYLGCDLAADAVTNAKARLMRAGGQALSVEAVLGPREVEAAKEGVSIRTDRAGRRDACQLTIFADAPGFT